MLDKISLFQNNRNWNSIRSQVISLIDQEHHLGLAQNTPLVQKLEKRLAEKYNRKHCVTVASCTDAILISLKCLNLPHNASIAVSNYTFTASAHAISRAGFNVVPVDVDQNYCINPDHIQNVSAVVAVDMFGNMSQWNRLSRFTTINDAAQSMESQGKKWSVQYGETACISFSPSKPISSWGSGGAILTDNDDIANLAKCLRLHGKGNNNNNIARDPGLNSMISAFEAACIWVGLDLSEQWQRRRDQIARYLSSESKYECSTDFSLAQHTHQKLVFRSDNRDAIIDYFNRLGIESTVHYKNLINDESLYQTIATMPVSDYYKKVSFTVPNQHTLTDEEVERIAKALK